LKEQMNPYFFVAMQDEPAALALLERELGSLQRNRRLVLTDRDKALILAMVNRAGTLYETLRQFSEREISYAMFAHSSGPMPGMAESLEIQRFEFDRKSNAEILAGATVSVPPRLRRRVMTEMRATYPDLPQATVDRLLRLLWLNNPTYVQVSPVRRVALVLHLLHQGNQSGGLFLDVEAMPEIEESRVLFAVGNPPQRDFLLQVMEVFKRLDIGVGRAYCLTISNGIHPYFLGTFYVRCHSDNCSLAAGTPLFRRLREELATTQLLATRSSIYRDFVTTGMLAGSDAALINAFIAFCHTQLAHCQPDRFGLDDVRNAFTAHPEISQQLVELFRLRFDPAVPERDARYAAALAATTAAARDYATGHRHLDEIRRTIFRGALLLVTHTLKTNFFVVEKQAVAFRLDPAYLQELGAEFTADLPAATPFRVTFFSSRFGAGYHIGFSDIARGGWRTVIARNADDLATAATTLFRENFVLAHTQHFKNKDIYEGGSKLVVVLDAADLRSGDHELVTWRLYKLQYGIANAFLDVFVTRDGVAVHPAVVDFYRQDEPIELGPDENMHDGMIEAIAALSRKRGYLLGIGIMSSKRVGINHKEYGVTSTGVVTFAAITMGELGIDIDRDPFTVKFTGGPNGDVAGNALRLMLARCPQMRVCLVLDGTAAVADPNGASHDELRRIVLQQDLDAFDPARLGVGGVMLFRTGRRQEGLRELYRRVTRTADGLREEWISLDEFHHEFDSLVFRVPADLFIPAGGRPETIDRDNWEQFLHADGTPSARVIVEGANSFLTPEARVQLQKRGVLIMRDASANKCGVISSSYEIIANLLFTESEFLAHKERYVADVLTILEQRAADEARLILKRRREQPGLLMTEISDALSTEINGHYARLFAYFQANPALCNQPLFRRAILHHLPRMLREDLRFRRRIGRLPQKYLFAILAAEIGASLVYHGDQQADFAEMLRRHVSRHLASD
jgi:glutamate dehydrogenase